jgi:DNA primase
VPGLIPEPVLEQIRQNNDVVEVIGSYFPLKRAGANFRALCPFHKEKTPSFNVNPSKQIWHCFGCGEGGDVFKFVMKYENLDFIASVRRLAERAGIKLEYEEREGEAGHDQKDQLLKLHEVAANFFHHNLMKEPSAKLARDYLTKRKITSETAKKWRLGYSPEGWDGLIKHAGAKKFTAETVTAGGLALEREKGDGYYDRFRGRLMFPICDEQGRAVGFSGRILTDAKDQPKYVNSPETAIFQKGRILFALDKAKRAIIEEKCTIICEGQLDTIACHEAGIENVVAPQGTALTEQHLRILKRYADDIILMFDSDAAGSKATTRSLSSLVEMASDVVPNNPGDWVSLHAAANPTSLLGTGLVIRVVSLPQDKDPDSFVREFGAAKLKELVAEAPSFFAYLLEKLISQTNVQTEKGKLQVAMQMLEVLSKVRSPILQSTYVRKMATRLDIPEQAIVQELRKSRSSPQRDHSHMASDDDATEDAADFDEERPRGLPAEEMLLRTMLADERVVELAAEKLDLAWLSDSLAGQTVHDVLRLYNGRNWTGPNSLLNQPQNDQTSRLVSELLLNQQAVKQPEAAAADCLATLEQHWVKQRLAEVRRQLERPGLSATDSAPLHQQLLDLDSRLRHIATFLKGKP